MSVRVGHCRLSCLLYLYYCARQIVLTVFLYYVYGYRVTLRHRSVSVGTRCAVCAVKCQRKH